MSRSAVILVLLRLSLTFFAFLSGGFSYAGYSLPARKYPSSAFTLLGVTVEHHRDTGHEEAFDLYSRDLQDQVNRESSEYKVIDDEAGFFGGKRSILSSCGRMIKKPFQWLGRKLSSPPRPGNLILLRCGQSEWNANGTFTGET
jgi:hypothetical protein